MSKFEPKITPRKPFMAVMESADDWCLRNVNENLRAFKAEYRKRCQEHAIRYNRYFDWSVLDAMLPDDPPKATGDDARDALRFKYLAHLRSEGVPILLIEGNDLRAAIDQALPGSQLQEAIDAAMAREREAAK